MQGRQQLFCIIACSVVLVGLFLVFSDIFLMVGGHILYEQLRRELHGLRPEEVAVLSLLRARLKQTVDDVSAHRVLAG